MRYVLLLLLLWYVVPSMLVGIAHHHRICFPLHLHLYFWQLLFAFLFISLHLLLPHLSWTPDLSLSLCTSLKFKAICII